MNFSISHRQIGARQNTYEVKFPISQINNALIFSTEHLESRIVLCIDSLNDVNTSFNKLIELTIENQNIYYEFADIDDLIEFNKQLQYAKYKKSKIYFRQPINSYNMLYFITQFNISDILIGEPLTFDLPQVNQAINGDIEKPHINIRVRPADGMPALFTYIDNIDDGIKHFWVTPQTMHLYESCVDIFDLTDDDEIREKGLYDIYTKGEYLGDLRSLCKHMKSTIPCDFFTEQDITKRISCRQRCMRPGTTTCHYCQQINDTYELMKKLKRDENGKIIH